MPLQSEHSSLEPRVDHNKLISDQIDHFPEFFPTTKIISSDLPITATANIPMNATASSSVTATAGLENPQNQMNSPENFGNETTSPILDIQNPTNEGTPPEICFVSNEVDDHLENKC